MFEIIILSIIQGITEFLPISSSAHLILASEYLSFGKEDLTLDISLHLGSLLAVIIFFKKEILNFLHNKSLFFKIIIGSFPTIISGYLLVKLNLIDHLRSNYIIGITTLLFGLILYFADKSKVNKSINHDFTLKDSIIIGFIQIASLVPGVSRSGVTITGARILKFNRVDSAKISFLLSIPTLITVSMYGILKIIELKNIQITTLNFTAFILSFFFSFLSLKIFIKFLKKFSMVFFVIYRVVLGIIIITYAFN